MPMGLKALTRVLRADESPELLAHLLALDEGDRRLRFAQYRTTACVTMSKIRGEYSNSGRRYAGR